MSRYTFIASDNQLPEIDQSGFIKRKVKDIKKMTPLPRGPVDWDELDDEADVLYAESESDLGGLQVSLCNNTPYDLEHYIQKNYVYWLGGNFQSKCVQQLLDYLQANVSKEDKVELWSIWFGDGIQKIKRKMIPLEAITGNDLELLGNIDCCISIAG
ncbi:hypothetical protein [Brevibacillus sp. SYSU BS000544]|uniref:hypothetical protein n=1 Tax=Brevibacillus sp. SYSU BS000544 TaxID=3416443 RepID=UPI003CE52745